MIKPEYFKFYDDEIVRELDATGNFIDRRVLKYDKRRTYEDDTYKITTVDLAVSTKDTADYTVICTATITKDADIFVEDIIRDRIEAPNLIPILQSVYNKYQPSFIGIE